MAGLKNTSTADLGRFLVQDDSSQDGINDNASAAAGAGGVGEPAVITLAMEHRGNDDHYLSAVNHDEDTVGKDDHDMAFMPQNLR